MLEYSVITKYNDKVTRRFETIYINEAQEYFKTQINQNHKAQEYDIRVIHTSGPTILSEYYLAKRLDK